MTFPDISAVESADKFQLARWMRFLPSPGEDAAGTRDFDEAFAREAKVMERIIARFAQEGGWTPEISKAVGW
ncbi:hypothetical protein GURKE_01350 [Brevundimonas phage vB_BpoS-Gurke]|uniref:Uncharacterized protein n=1 Tax=Brevundimonas phage vB_BpoS-Gurke TaxID=2948599 RepID=A0A9E7N1I9_9CAUD|nr:hypothetical protein GURKE_01350 [Brevundimonas phage vB_BpoS-Gurke]